MDFMLLDHKAVSDWAAKCDLAASYISSKNKNASTVGERVQCHHDLHRYEGTGMAKISQDVPGCHQAIKRTLPQ